MKHSLAFVASSVGLVFAGGLAAGLFAEGRVRESVFAAAALVLATQLPLHFALRGWRERNDRFVAAMAAGFVARAGVLALAVVLFVIPGRVAAAPFLLALGGFLLAIVVVEATIESRRVRGRTARSAEAAASS